MKNRTKAATRARILPFSVFLLILLCFSHTALAAEENDQPMTVLCLPDSFVTVRASPSLHGSAEGRLYLGDTVSVSSTRRDSEGRSWAWCEGIACESGCGYVCAGYLAAGDCTLYPDGVPASVAGNGRVALRKTVGGTRKAWLHPGDVLTVYAVCGEWAVTSGGYVKSDFVVLEEAKEK